MAFRQFGFSRFGAAGTGVRAAVGARVCARRLADAFVACAVLAVMACGVARAQDSVFVVARVPVQATADTATAAKDLAQSTGRRRALEILLRRLTPESDWRYLPASSVEAAGGGGSPVAGDTLAGNPIESGGGVKRPVRIGDSQLVGLEQSFEVYDEKSSSRIYRAFITYRFKPDAIRQLLKNAALPYSEAQTRTALILPVLQTDTGVYLWESNNPWMAAWKSRPLTHELTPFITPAGGLEDEATITARGALALDADAAEALAARYRVSQVIVAHARLRQANGEDRLQVRLMNAYSEAASSDALPVSDGEEFDREAASMTPGSRHTSDVYGYEAPRNGDFRAGAGEQIAAASGIGPSGNFPMLAERMIDETIANYASGWKDRTLIDHASDAVLTATAFFNGMADWAKIRAALVETPLVGAVQISALSPRGAELAVRVFGDPGRLTTSLENQGIVFWTETGERWFLATPDVASGLRGQRFLRTRGGRRMFGEVDETGTERADDPLAPAYGDMTPRPAAYRDDE